MHEPTMGATEMRSGILSTYLIHLTNSIGLRKGLISFTLYQPTGVFAYNT